MNAREKHCPGTTTVVYISDLGSDQNDGMTQTDAVHSWSRASHIAANDAEFRFVGLATLRRIVDELERASRSEIYSKSDWG
jgi:hypothetical protein